MSIDPFTGRNPSYCFVELITKAQADEAMRELNGRKVLGRPVKIGPGVAKSNKRSRTDDGRHQDQSRYRDHQRKPVFQRWTRTDAPTHFQGYSEQGRRLWVGGLPKMSDHYAVEAGVRELFKGFKM